MQLTRISAIVLLLGSVAVCGVSIMIGLTPVVSQVRLDDGSAVTPRMGMMASSCGIIPAVVMAVAGILLLWLIVPNQRERTAHEQATDRMRAQMLNLYMEWIGELQLTQALCAPDRGEYLRQTVRTSTLSLLPELDAPRRRLLIQFLYDAQLISGVALIDLSGANLRDVDLQGADLRGADLRGVDLRGARLVGARLEGANLSGAQITPGAVSGTQLSHQG